MRFYDISASTDDTPKKIPNSCSIFLYVDIYVFWTYVYAGITVNGKLSMKTGKIGITLH